jgi:hypothetical protein
MNNHWLVEINHLPERHWLVVEPSQKYTHQCGFKIVDVLVGGIPTPPKNIDQLG